MAEDQIDKAGSGNDEASGIDRSRALQLLWSQWELPGDTKLLEISAMRHLPDAKLPRSKGKVEISEVYTNLGLLHSGAASDNGYMELETEGFLKSRMRENRTYGSVRGSDIPSR